MTADATTRWEFVYDPMPDDGEDGGCPNGCSEGWLFECIDGCCVDAEIGCNLCERRCDICWKRERVPA